MNRNSSMHLPLAFAWLSCLTSLTQAKLTWGNTKFLMVFGDSYTTTGCFDALSFFFPNLGS